MYAPKRFPIFHVIVYTPVLFSLITGERCRLMDTKMRSDCEGGILESLENMNSLMHVLDLTLVIET